MNAFEGRIQRAMKYTEIYADENGVSHFRDVEMELTLAQIAPPAPPVHLSAFKQASEVVFTSVPSGWVGGWHGPPSEGFMFVLEGEVEIEVGDGEVRRFPQGAVWFHKDLVGRGHDSRIVSEKDALLVMVKLPDE